MTKKIEEEKINHEQIQPYTKSTLKNIASPFERNKALNSLTLNDLIALTQANSKFALEQLQLTSEDVSKTRQKLIKTYQELMKSSDRNIRLLANTVFGGFIDSKISIIKELNRLDLHGIINIIFRARIELLKITKEFDESALYLITEQKYRTFLGNIISDNCQLLPHVDVTKTDEYLSLVQHFSTIINNGNFNNLNRYGDIIAKYKKLAGMIAGKTLSHYKKQIIEEIKYQIKKDLELKLATSFQINEIIGYMPPYKGLPDYKPVILFWDSIILDQKEFLYMSCINTEFVDITPENLKDLKEGKLRPGFSITRKPIIKEENVANAKDQFLRQMGYKEEIPKKSKFDV